MAEHVKLPADFVWSEAPHTIKHRASGKIVSMQLVQKVGGIGQGEIDYMVAKLRREYRRDRLYIAVRRDIGAFRWYQIQARERGYAF